MLKKADHILELARLGLFIALSIIFVKLDFKVVLSVNLFRVFLSSTVVTTSKVDYIRRIEQVVSKLYF